MIVELADDGGWAAYLPDLPAVFPLGETQDEVAAGIHDALDAFADEMRSIGNGTRTAAAGDYSSGRLSERRTRPFFDAPVGSGSVWTTTSAIQGSSGGAVPRVAGELVRLLERRARADGDGDEEHVALLGRKQPQVAGGRVRVSTHKGLDRLERLRVVAR